METEFNASEQGPAFGAASNRPRHGRRLSSSRILVADDFFDKTGATFQAADPTELFQSSRIRAVRQRTRALVLPRYQHLEELTCVIPAKNIVGDVDEEYEDYEEKMPLRDLEKSMRECGPRPLSDEKLMELEEYRRADTKPLRAWKTKRCVDGKIFLAREFTDYNGVLEEVHDTLKNLFKHPNLINLEEIVIAEDIAAESVNFMVWEDCDQGTLRRMLYRKVNAPLIHVQEDFIWHVLDGLARAFLWLHHGIKMFPGPSRPAFDENDDWQSIMYGPLSPEHIYFKTPESGQRYPTVKLGCFENVHVCPGRGGRAAMLLKTDWDNPYVAPELQTHGWRLESDIYSLGAIAYLMMTGTLLPSNSEDGVPSAEGLADATYSTHLRGLVLQMTLPDPAQRPSALELWRTTSVQALRHQPAQIRPSNMHTCSDALTKLADVHSGTSARRLSYSSMRVQVGPTGENVPKWGLPPASRRHP